MWLQTEEGITKLDDLWDCTLHIDSKNPFVELNFTGQRVIKLPCDSVQDAHDLFARIVKMIGVNNG